MKKRTILQERNHSSGNADKLANIARTEKDATLRRSAIRDLGMMTSAKTSDMLRAIYAAETTPDFKKERSKSGQSTSRRTPRCSWRPVEGGEGSDLMKSYEMVTKLSTMKNKEATDYMLELLK